MARNTARLQIDVWSDIACPWCYVGKRRLERALQSFDARDSVDLLWHAIELNPSAPREIVEGGSHAQRLAKKYGSRRVRFKVQIKNNQTTLKPVPLK